MAMRAPDGANKNFATAHLETLHNKILSAISRIFLKRSKDVRSSLDLVPSAPISPNWRPPTSGVGKGSSLIGGGQPPNILIGRQWRQAGLDLEDWPGGRFGGC